MKMKKIFLGSIVLFSLLTGCNIFNSPSSNQSSNGEGVNIENVSVILPNGTPALAMGELLNEADAEVVTDPSLLQTALVSKTDKMDLVIAPLTAGTNLYLKGKSDYKLEAVITTNNAYLISRGNDKLLTPENLKGKDIVGFQETNTPGIILKTYLEKYKIEANITFVGNVGQSKNAFTDGQTDYAVVAEPQLTELEATYTDLNILNLGDEITTGDQFVPQAAIFVNPEVRNDEDVKAFLSRLEANVYELNNSPEIYAQKLLAMNSAYFNSYTVERLTTALPRCNLAYKKGSQNKASIEAFYDSCDTYISNMFGGVKPNDEFYN